MIYILIIVYLISVYYRYTKVCERKLRDFDKKWSYENFSKLWDQSNPTINNVKEEIKNKI